MRCATRLVLVASVLLAMCAGPALAELTLPPINYLGSFRMNGSFGSYGYSGLAYHGAGAQETLYHSNWSTIYGNDIPVPLDPGVVGWGGLNTQTQLLTPTNLGGAIAGGLAVHNDATGAPRLYRGGNNNQVAVCNMDLTGSTYLGTGGVSHHRGFSGPAPAGFVTNVGVPAAQDMLDGFAWCGAPWLYTLAPQLGDGTTVPSTQIMQITNAYKHPNSHYGYAAVEWVQPLGTGDWQDGFVVMAEQDSGPQALNWSLLFLDPSQLPYVGYWPGADYVMPADGARFDIDPYLSPGLTSRGTCGMAFDPLTGRLFVGESSGNPGNVVHVFQIGEPPLPIAEPGALSLLAAGLGAVLVRRRRRT